MIDRCTGSTCCCWGWGWGWGWDWGWLGARTDPSAAGAPSGAGASWAATPPPPPCERSWSLEKSFGAPFGAAAGPDWLEPVLVVQPARVRPARTRAVSAAGSRRPAPTRRRNGVVMVPPWSDESPVRCAKRGPRSVRVGTQGHDRVYGSHRGGSQC